MCYAVNMIVSEGFQGLQPFLQKAVVMKANGESHAAIAKAIGRSVVTVDRYFGTGGVLQSPLLEYRETLGNAALAEAKDLVRILAVEATATLRELSQKPYPAQVRVAASKALAQSLLGRTELLPVPKDKTPGLAAIDDEIEAVMASTLTREAAPG